MNIRGKGASVSIALILSFTIVGCSPTQQSDPVNSPAEGGNARNAALIEFENSHTNHGNDVYKGHVERGATCRDCHGFSSEELFTLDAEDVSVDIDACVGCHAEAAWPDELEMTIDNIRSWDTYINAGSADHIDWIHSNMEYTTGRPLHGDWEHPCSSCHTMHQGAQAVSCTSCHNADAGASDCESCHGFMLGEGQEFEGKSIEELTDALGNRLPPSGHIQSVMTAPSGWLAPESLSNGND